MTYRNFFLAAMSFVAMAGNGALAADKVCADHNEGAALDFWVGSWRVTSMDGATEYGSNRIEKALDGCAIFEHWRSARGGEGKSLFYFDAREGEWAQLWVTPDTNRPGGLKHKFLRREYEGPGVRFQGEYPGDGGIIRDRTTLSARDDGSVRQHIEVSIDGGANWQTTFDALYHPVTEE